MLFKNPVRTSKRTAHFTITKINWLMLFKEIIAVYSENHTKPIITKYSVTDCYDSWNIQLPPRGIKGLRAMDVNKYSSWNERQSGPVQSAVSFSPSYISTSPLRPHPTGRPPTWQPGPLWSCLAQQRVPTTPSEDTSSRNNDTTRQCDTTVNKRTLPSTLHVR
jgi:hypothetical protein